MVQKTEYSRPKKNKTKTVVPLPLKLANESSWQVLDLLHSLLSYFRGTTPICIGTFMEFGRFIWIHDKSQFYTVYQAGFFGKGALSRSEPTWFKRTEQQSELSLEDLTVERRKQRRQKKQKSPIIEHTDALTANELREITNEKDVEMCQLDMYEAYFLLYALNVLEIRTMKQDKLSIKECWTTFCQYDASFALNYAVYHYYRSLGWVPKNGTKFGVDFEEVGYHSIDTTGN
ncbi:hypothetical protein K501DRAFT_330981 [Backusella circina FSU 941]|nr:hypothetical protein K501DRAFT_330981 [Backusella circina FSU 941]